ncbi:hypothetical protein [Pectinatus sottacetonis]|uniref:hypothetical protein n=1 Tax=Pectinatus sottacetonis TaxID=1002795 RepID=UPI0018C62960|nr:hypothetical protein [Pectinatus sottacetonis]
MNCSPHPKFQIPDDPHGKSRYESAMRHVEAAKKQGKSTAELHAIFKKVMAFDPKDVESIPKDAAHAKYRSAVIHAQKAMAAGKSSKEVHEIFHRIKNGESSGKCTHHDK